LPAIGPIDELYFFHLFDVPLFILRKKPIAQQS